MKACTYIPKQLLLSLCMGLFPLLLRAQLNTSPRLLDTIYVSEHMTTVMIFPESVSLVDLGTGSFQASTHDKVLLLKAEANSYGILPTTLFIRYGSEGYFQGFIAYSAKPKEPFYDWRRMEPGMPGKMEKEADKNSDQEAIASNEEESSKAIKSSQDSSLIVGLNTLKTKERTYLSIGELKHNMELSLSNIYHDSSRTYISLSIKNSSSLPYLLAAADIQLREPVKRKSLSDMILPIYPEYKELPDRIDPYGSGMLYFVIPHQPAPKKALLEFSIREKTGTRALSLSVPYTEILKAPLLP